MVLDGASTNPSFGQIIYQQNEASGKLLSALSYMQSFAIIYCAVILSACHSYEKRNSAVYTTVTVKYGWAGVVMQFR